MKQVLVIDDSEVNLLLVKSALEETEVNVFIESSSLKAMSVIRKIHPDLIVLDLMMPHVDGFQILEKLQQDTALSSIPVLVISARQDEEAVHRAMQLGAAGYIKKPIDLTMVTNQIITALKHSA